MLSFIEAYEHFLFFDFLCFFFNVCVVSQVVRSSTSPLFHMHLLTGRQITLFNEESANGAMKNLNEFHCGLKILLLVVFQTFPAFFWPSFRNE